MRLGQVRKRIAESCCFVWVVPGETFRDATYAEAAKMRKEFATNRDIAQEVLGAPEVPGVRFLPPSTTNYEFPREAYEEIDSPCGVRTCLWPSKSPVETRRGFALVREAQEFCEANA